MQGHGKGVKDRDIDRGSPVSISECCRNPEVTKNMTSKFAYALPFIIFAWFPITFAVTYTVAVLKKDVVPLFSYISDTGTWSPESCIFGQLLNMGALLMLVQVYLRYKQLEATITQNGVRKSIEKWNKIGSYAGFTSCFGVTVAGNFQELNQLIVHLIGAGTAFGVGACYFIIQVYLSYTLYPLTGNRRVNHVRLVLGVVCLITNSLVLIFGLISFFQFKGDDLTKWKKEDGGYVFHIVSVVSEWILAFAFITFILTLSVEMKHIKIKPPEITIVKKTTS